MTFKVIRRTCVEFQEGTICPNHINGNLEVDLQSNSKVIYKIS